MNADQLPLWEDRTRSIDERFAAFHKRHPEVYRMFRRFAQQFLDSGHPRCSAKMLIERVRWECSVAGNLYRGFRINNNFTSRYARMLMSDDPAFAGFFQKRRLKT